MRTLPFFLDSSPRSRRPAYPTYRRDAEAEVVIVGGGLTGCACAAVFATAGVKVVLLEADRIGAAAAAANTGLLRPDFDASFQDAAARHGRRMARSAWDAIRRASLDFAAAIRRHGIRTDLATQPLITFTRDGEAAARRLRREYESRRDAGVDASWLNARALLKETGIEGDGALRTDTGTIDPYRTCVGLAEMAARRGARIFERSAVRRIRAGRRAVNVKTDTGTLAADAVVVATGPSLVDDLRALRRHFRTTQRYAVVTERLPGRIKRELGAHPAALRDTAVPPHQLRWVKEDRVLFSGADHPLRSRRGDAAIIPHANRLMYELSTIYPAISGLQPEWAWDAFDSVSADGLPVIGPHRNFPRHLFALGGAQHGAGVAWLAARALLRAYRGEPAKGDEALGFARLL